MPIPPPDYSPLTGSLVEFCKGIEAVLTTAIAELAYDGNPATIFYGDQDKFPTTPTYAVEPVRKDRDLDSERVGKVYDIYFTAQVIGYLTQIHQSEQIVREEVDVLGEKCEEIIHRDHKLGGLVQDVVVQTVESGFAYKKDSKYKAVILTVRGRSLEGLPC